MTDDDWRELGHRAVACRGWRWTPGMRALQDRGGGVEPVRLGATDEAGDEWPHPEAWPDLRDPATLGCLLALVREAHGPTACVVSSEEMIDGEHVGTLWSVGTADGRGPVISREEAEAEALVAALEAAP